MKSKELTTQQRIEILEDVLKKLERGDANGGLCYKIEYSVFELFRIFDKANKIIPIFTLKNAKMVTDIIDYACDETYWWDGFENYDFENRIKFVKWMINKEKEFLK